MSLPQQPIQSDLYPVSFTDNDWAQILNNNQEAQDLLSTAIAQHEQYKEEDPMKRKGIISQMHQASQRKITDGESALRQGSEGDNSSDEGHSPGEGKPAPKKAGRKPLTTEPTNKRKAQNRAAQRAFRDRKERYVKSLEERIKELEEQNPSKTDVKLAEENLNLKVLVQKLETENYFLKEQSFTFDFPISQPGLYNVAKAQRDELISSTDNAGGQSSSDPESSTSSPPSQTLDSESSSSTPAATTVQSKPFASANVAKPLTFGQLPWSPPSSVGDSVPNSPHDNDMTTPEQDTVAPQPSYPDNAGVVPRARNGSPEEIALFSSLLDGTGNTYAIGSSLNLESQNNSSLAPFNTMHSLGQPSAQTLVSSNPSPASTLTALSDHSPTPTLEGLVNVPLVTSANNSILDFTPTTTGVSVPPLTYEQTQALFTDFRDPSDPHSFFASFEDPVEPAFPNDAMGELFNNQLLDYTNAFANVASTPSREESQEFFGEVAKANAGYMLLPLEENEKAIPCPLAWQKLAKHPKFDDLDIDDLCVELKKKAKCSGHGPVIPMAEMDRLMNKLDQE
ncbi:DNA-binding transcription factor yap1 [Mortierella polycephala]|uniref:DNA-binding transcription factor yap1 n=1 Tax=Mortierella polycephala TaxID=41804 RepID=A0A9P6PK91_9FUNG|nr:DNA-binding transcription factor yap1 [Mortierella polycephala]